MASSRTIFKFGNYNFPNEYIEWDSIKIKPNQRQDLDSYTDASGLTRRNAIEHTKSDVQFSTRQLCESQVRSIMSNITSNYIHPRERDANCEYFDPEHGTTKTGHFYLDPSQEFSIIGINYRGEFIYKSISFHFVEY